MGEEVTSQMSDDELIQRCKEDLVFVAPECWLDRIAYHSEVANDLERFNREMDAFVDEHRRKK